MDGNGQSEWHSIRPWAPRLALFVREITSVSATFILSSSLSNRPNGNSSQSDPSPASLGLIADDGHEIHSDSDENSSDSDEEDARRELIISNALAKGLSVNVNGSPWQRVLIRIDDKVDEAIIIIYGLMPGRQYDIDLALVQGGQGGVNLRRQVITEGTSVITFLSSPTLLIAIQSQSVRAQMLPQIANNLPWTPHPMSQHLPKLHPKHPICPSPPHLDLLALPLLTHLQPTSLSKNAPLNSNTTFPSSMQTAPP
jgi:hypothetical protein